MAAEAHEIPQTGSLSRLEHIWQPLRIGKLTVKNRIMMTAQTTVFGKDHILGDRHVEYYRERAKGGVGLFICEQQAGHNISKGSFYEGCTAWEKRAIPQFAKLADAVHEHGAKQLVQLFGCGVHDKGTTIFDEWHPLWGVSAIPSVYHHEMPMVMEKSHIAEIVQAFGESALNVKVSGCDGVELHGAHSYLLGQFLSRAYNARTDEYGGSVANRARIFAEIGESIREQVGPDFALGIRLSYDEFIGPTGITAEESDEVVALLSKTGLFDFFNISAGGYHTLFRAVAPTGSVKGEFLPFGKRAKAAAGDRARVFVVGRITDLTIAERALREGAADMIAMTRAMMADPYHVKKVYEGRAQEVVYCVGANECIQRAFLQRPATCVMNPAVGREARWQKENLRLVQGAGAKKIVVVGAGPGGMRTAEILGRRGHRVTLLEQQACIGGHLLPLLKLPSWKEWGVAIDNLRRGMEAGKVTVRTSVQATLATLKAEAPDIVVVATGSSWDRTGLTPYRPDRFTMPGANQDNVVDLVTAIERATADPRSLGAHVLIVDDSGSYPPLAIAELVKTTGAASKVTVITPRDTAGSDLIGRGELFLIMPKLLEAGVEVLSQYMLDRVDGANAYALSIWGGPMRKFEDVSTVVLSMTRSVNDGLYRQIRDDFPQVVRVGDCLAPRALVQVMYEAEEVGRSL
jgi:2,4-dienoyl-CoA reductase-like NADH-dependent reductase (Old Yellow Enzyme family)